jgi:hypothetical protein
MFDFGLDLATDQNEEAAQILPGERHDHGTDAARGGLSGTVGVAPVAR